MIPNNKTSKGISIIEVLTVVAIVGIVTSISLGVFSSLTNSQDLDKETEIVVSYINKARSNAINSLEYMAHGASFSSSTVVVFYGTTPVGTPTSTTYTLSSKEKIWNVSFSNGASYIYFNKLSGEPNATGTLKVRKSDGTQKTIIIYATGFIEVQ